MKKTAIYTRFDDKLDLNRIVRFTEKVTEESQISCCNKFIEKKFGNCNVTIYSDIKSGRDTNGEALNKLLNDVSDYTDIVVYDLNMFAYDIDAVQEITDLFKSKGVNLWEARTETKINLSQFISSNGIKVVITNDPSPEACERFVRILLEMEAKKRNKPIN